MWQNSCTVVSEYFCFLKLFRKTFFTIFPIITGQSTHSWVLPGSPLRMARAPSFTLIPLTTLVFPTVMLPSVFLSFLLYLRLSFHFSLPDYMQLSFMTQATLSVPIIELSVSETQFSSCLVKSKWNWLSLCVLHPVGGPALFPILMRIPAGLSLVISRFDFLSLLNLMTPLFCPHPICPIFSSSWEPRPLFSSKETNV